MTTDAALMAVAARAVEDNWLDYVAAFGGVVGGWSSDRKLTTVSWLTAAPASKSGVPPTEWGEAWAKTRSGIAPAVLRLAPARPRVVDLCVLRERPFFGAGDMRALL